LKQYLLKEMYYFKSLLPFVT